jgi:putative membrane protein
MKRKTLLLAAIVFAVLGLFLARIPMRADLWYISVIAILLFGAPVIFFTIRWLGRRRGLFLIAALGIYALLFETIAVKTGVPYGNFGYGGLLGPKLFDAVPATVVIAWTPLVLGILAVLQTIKPLWKQALLATLGLVVIDMVLDPAAVHIGFWSWVTPGLYYGVPLINFVGWAISGSTAVCAIIYVRQRFNWPPIPAMLGWNLLAIIFLWTMVTMFAGQLIPALLGFVVCSVLYRRLTKTP